MQRPEPPITRRLILKETGFEFVADPPCVPAVAAEEKEDWRPEEVRSEVAPDEQVAEPT